ncbi:MAG: xanthine dehydrogenase family protein molybdopterin-binding subunit [Thermoleophilia bacterium]
MASVEQAASPARFVRPDGKEKVTGTGRYTADLALPGMAHARFRYADHPHARIVRVDASRARALPGVLAVLTHEDVPDVKYGGMVQDRRLFARDAVRWEGDIVAGVAALTPELAERAAAAIQVEYEPLPALPDFAATHAPGVPLVHEDWEADEGSDSMGREGNRIAYSTIVRGDADAGMAAAEVVVRGSYSTDSCQGVPIEPHAVVAEWHGDRVTIWSSTQVPYAARAGVAHALQIPESRVRIVVPLLGGGFGAKCDHHFESHVAALARAARRPVKLVLTRREEFVAVDHRREGMVIELETGARRDGTIVARRARLVLDKGAYCGEGGFFAQMAAMHAVGPYEVENVDVAASMNYSTTQPSSSIRAPTAPQVCWALEQHMDDLARELGLDPVELRRRTLIREGSIGPAGQVFEAVGMRETLERAVELIGYGRELPEDEAIGVACGWWPCFGAPAGAYVTLNGDGTATVLTGAQENGTGAVMAFPVLVAEQLGLRPEDVDLLYQDTDAGPWDMGSCGSQTTFNSGRAAIAAAADLREQLLDAAAEDLEAARDDLELVEGAIRVAGAPERQVTIAELAGSGRTFQGKGAGVVPEAQPVEAEGCVGKLGLESFLAPQLITHAVHVKVDRDTGVVRVLRVAAAHDSGIILNPLGANGQVYGGVVMGIGQALTEGTQHDEAGRQRNPHLLDYKLVTSADAPRIDIAWVETDTPNAGPKGSKGIGEPPCVATPGAIANAIAKVIGTQVRQLPMLPERVWAASREVA